MPGIGPGAHGRLTLDGARVATETALAPAAWLERVETHGTGETVRESLDADAVLAEAVMMGLRLTGGIRLERLASLRVVGNLFNKINELCAEQLLEQDSHKVRVTEAGRLLLNRVATRLLS